jgi:hypothetical protein
MSRPDLVRRAQEYACRKRLVLGQQLGSGVHGTVWAAGNQTEGGSVALKAHERELDYCRERDIYHRLKQLRITNLDEFSVPVLLDSDDHLWTLEMTVVTRPFVLDFAGAFLDAPVEFPEEVVADWRQEKLEQFGKKWSKVQSLLARLAAMGIYVADVNPGNIAFDE